MGKRILKIRTADFPRFDFYKLAWKKAWFWWRRHWKYLRCFGELESWIDEERKTGIGFQRQFYIFWTFYWWVDLEIYLRCWLVKFFIKF